MQVGTTSGAGNPTSSYFNQRRIWGTYLLAILLAQLCMPSMPDNTANDFLISKWKLWYKFLDVNHDGILSRADVDAARKKLFDLHRTETGKKVQLNITKWWSKYIFRGITGDLAEKPFVGLLSKDLKEDKANFEVQMKRCFYTFFSLIDTNKDKSISEEEFLIAFKAYGHENIALDIQFFKAYGPGNGLVPLGKIIDSWVEFATVGDRSQSSIVKTALEGGV